MKDGILLVNLGSPDSPETPDVRKYLKEFLSDDRVLDTPKVVQQTLLNLVILPTRPKESGSAYREIWTDEGSPLIISTFKQQEKLAKRVDCPVEVGMRYGSPSTAVGIQRMVGQGVERIFLIPLYPHYAMSSYETAVVKVREELAKIAPDVELTVQPPFFNDPDYIEALAHVTEPYLEKEFDTLLFSYHGIPERHVRKMDPSGGYCLATKDCCDRKHPFQGGCYRAQVFATSRALTKRLGLTDDQWHLAFQSRLGRDPWLKPYTDHELEKFPTQGRKKILVICPAFVSDCLETLEEIEIRGREDFEKAGGVEFTYIPCLNDHDRWIDVLERMYKDYKNGALLHH